jgi:murein DD-endopeptidase MepM/ murein hydrolase activator NlpD
LSANTPRAAAAPVPVQSGAQRNITVQDGETLYDVAKRSGLTPRAIIDANNLQPPYRIAKGQSLILPAARTHTVVRGDTLYAVSRYYGIDSYELARLNNLQPPYNIRVNQQLALPGGDGRPSGIEVVDRSASMPAIAPVPRGTVERVQVEEVKPAAGGVSSSILPPPVSSSGTREIAAPVVPPSAQSSAQSLPTYIPSAEVRAPVSTPMSSSGPEVASAPVTTPIERQAQTQAAAEPAPETAQEKAQLASLPRSTAKPRAGGKFIWPVEGKLMSEYGSKGDGLHNDGINIAAPKGAPVFAAAPGVVAYAGNEIRGFGNLLLIQHADGWMTAYAHNDKLLVRRGDRVQQGQQISAVGATGNVSSPQLHFEIRRGKRAVDPLDQLGSASARS